MAHEHRHERHQQRPTPMEAECFELVYGTLHQQRAGGKWGGRGAEGEREKERKGEGEGEGERERG